MNATVLLLGETGVGKNVFANAIHDAGPRRHRPMIYVNAAAIPATLIESELFGHERGAFTDAVSRQAGRFEMGSSQSIKLDVESSRRPIATSNRQCATAIHTRQFSEIARSRCVRTSTGRNVVTTHVNP